MSKFKVWSLLTALFVCMSGLAFGQVTGGRVTGAVFDANGGAVQNANVTLTNKTTGQILATQTTDTGSYTFPNVSVGEYTISIENAGFQSATQDLRVALNQETSVGVTLQAAGVTGGVVEVTATSEALVQSDSSQLGKSFETRQVLDLPIFGNQNALALLSPNVVQAGAGTSGSGGSVGGTRARYNSFNIDGIDNNEFSITGPATGVIQDAVQEFTLLTNNYNAEFGSAAGGQFNTITRTGTNEVHGSAFVYTQNQRLNAASTQQERQLNLPLAQGGLAEKPRFRDTRFGATIGGPILPNRLFFFGAYQSNPINRTATSASFLAPTAAGLAQLASAPGVSPLIVSTLQNNLILAAGETSRRNVFGQSVPFGSVAINNPAGSNENQLQLNIDHLRGTKDQFRYRFSFDRFRSEDANGLGNPQFNSLVNTDSRLFSATYVRTFNASLVNDLRLAYRYYILDFPLRNDAFNTFPNFSVSALNLSLGPNANLPQGRFSHTYQVYDSLNYIRGAHTFKFGGEYQRILANSRFLPRGRGDYLYNTFEELLTDAVPTQAIRGVGFAGFVSNRHKFYTFGQDDWKVTPNLTLNLGLRYEYNSLPRDVALQELNSIADAPGVFVFGVPKTDKNNFAPRVGFAYSPDFESGFGNALFGERGQSSIRANFAVSYGETFANLNILQLPPQFQQELRPGDVAGFNTAPGFIQRGGLPDTPLPPSTTALARARTGSFVVDQTQPYTLAYTLGFQRELTPTMAIEVRYLGTRSRRLPMQVQVNTPTITSNQLIIPTLSGQPTAAQLAGLSTLGSITGGQSIVAVPREFASLGFASNITSYQPRGNAQYDSGSVSLTRRFSRGFAGTAAYTFSKTIDDSTNEVFSSSVNPRRPQDFRNLRDERALSANDIPHRFAASFNYEVPNFSDNGVVGFFVEGLQINGIFQAQSGQPFTPLSIIDSNLDRDSFAGDRSILNPNGTPGTGSGITPFALVNGVATQVPVGDLRTVAYVATNPNAQYIQAGPGARATAGRNTLRSNDFNRTDIVALKNFRFGEERYTIQVGVETVNVFNQRIFTIGNFASITPTVGGLSPTGFGFPDVSSPLFNDYSTGNFSGRTVQVRAKFIF